MREQSSEATTDRWWSERLDEVGIMKGDRIDAVPSWIATFDAVVSALLGVACVALVIAGWVVATWLLLLPIPLLLVPLIIAAARYRWLTRTSVFRTADGFEVRGDGARLVRWDELLEVSGGLYWYTIEYLDAGVARRLRRPRRRFVRHPPTFCVRSRRVRTPAGASRRA